MDSETLVSDRLTERRVQDGLKLLTALRDNHFPFGGACWGKGYRWILYISTPRVDEVGKLAAYGEFLPLLRQLEDVWITSSDITLAGMTHHTARSISVVQSLKSMVGRLYEGAPFGGTPFTEMYVYPANIPAEPAAV